MYYKKLLKYYYVLILILLFLNNIFSEENNYLFNWKTTKEVLSGESLLTENLIDDVNDSIITIFNDLTTDCRLSNKFNEDEKLYYFTNNDSIEYNNIDDFICMKEVIATYKFYFRHYYDGWYSQRNISVKFGATIDFNKERDFSNIDYNSGKTGWNKYSWTQWHPGGENKKWESSLKTQIINIDQIDDGNPLIYTIPFKRCPAEDKSGNNYVLNFNYDFHNDTDVRATDFRDESYKTIYYKAKSPNPGITSLNFNVQNNEINIYESIDATIFSDYGVKILLLNIYKLDDQGKPIINEKEIIFENIDMIEVSGELVSEDSINSIMLPKEKYENEGKYLVILSAIDKFSKIYTFEPLNVNVDKTPPVVSGLEINDDLTVSSTFVTWDKIEDPNSMTIYESEEDIKNYIKVRYKSGEIKDLNNCFEFEFINNGIKFVDELLNKKTYIDKIYVTDKAGNQTVLVEDKNYNLDKENPVVSINNNKEYYNSNDFLELNIEDESKTKINKIELKINDNTYSLDSLTVNYSDFYYLDILRIPLLKLNQMEGTFELVIEVEDESQNKNIETQNFILKIDDLAPRIEISLNSEIIQDDINEKNLEQLLLIQTDDLYFGYFNLIIISDYEDSLNNYEISNITNNNYQIDNLKTNDNINNEIIKIEIDAFDLKGNNNKIVKYIKLYNDNNAPIINSLKTSTNELNEDLYDINITDNTDITIWSKSIDISSMLTPPDESDFDNLNIDQNNDWKLIIDGFDPNDYEEDLYNLNSFTIYPGYASCVITMDKWGNKNHLIISNDKIDNNSVIITNKNDLFTYFGSENNGEITYSLKGVIYFKPASEADIIFTFDSNETLSFIPENLSVTILYFDDVKGKIKFVNNGGKITFDTENNKLYFKGLSNNEKDFSWFGIQNLSGTIEFININNDIIFENTISPFTFEDPVNDISLQNITFSKCLMGVHFIDNCENYNTLTIDNCNFNNLVYGVKFEIDSYENSDLYNYESSLNYLINTNSNFLSETISLGDIYCPVKGLLDID